MGKERKAAVIGAVFSKNREEVLLVQRRDVPVWTLPGGGIEDHETKEEALLRELKEETGYEVKIVRKVGLYHPLNRLSRTTHLYEAKIVGGTPERGEETKDLSFFPVSKLPKLLPPPYEEWILEAKNSKKYVERTLFSVNYPTLLKNLLLHPLLVSRFLLARIGLFFHS